LGNALPPPPPPPRALLLQRAKTCPKIMFFSQKEETQEVVGISKTKK
jgi:hypothetical protein